MTPGAATGGVRWVLRLEGAVVFLAALLAYATTGASWLLFALLLFVPDLSFLGYLAGPRRGTWIYNVAHTYAGALAFGVTGALLQAPLLLSLGLIWCAHIGLDRALGYGLKYGTGFNHTHLGRIGRDQGSSPPHRQQ